MKKSILMTSFLAIFLIEPINSKNIKNVVEILASADNVANGVNELNKTLARMLTEVAYTESQDFLKEVSNYFKTVKNEKKWSVPTKVAELEITGRRFDFNSEEIKNIAIVMSNLLKKLKYDEHKDNISLDSTLQELIPAGVIEVNFEKVQDIYLSHKTYLKLQLKRKKLIKQLKNYNNCKSFKISNDERKLIEEWLSYTIRDPYGTEMKIVKSQENELTISLPDRAANGCNIKYVVDNFTRKPWNKPKNDWIPTSIPK